ncbi:MAG: RNase P subunit [Thaumarchaeota archaeon]|nr:MAG: RNase P subunit [Nitrososphaerota archaeon]
MILEFIWNKFQSRFCEYKRKQDVFAISNARTNPSLAQRQASLAKKLSTKYRIRMPYDIRINFCKECKKFIAPGVNARIRIGRSSVKSIRITCGFCNHTYRKIIQKSIPKGQ